MLRRGMMIGMAAWLIGATPLARAAQRIYDGSADARQLIRAAVAEASKDRKNIVLVFGANWCPDCHALEAQMQSGGLAQLIKKNFVVVNIDVGVFNKNLDVAAHYGVPLKPGIPVFAILDSSGKLLYAQKHGQFENSRAVTYQEFYNFFAKWRPKR